MHTKITVILIENLECGDVGRTENHLVHPFDALDHLDALLLGKDRRAFVFGDFLVGVYAHNYLIAKCFGLSQRIGMPEVYHVVAIENDTEREEKRIEVNLIISYLCIYFISTNNTQRLRNQFTELFWVLNG